MEFKKEFMFLGIYDKSYDFETSHIIRYQVDFYDSLCGGNLSFNVYDYDKTSSLLNKLLELTVGSKVILNVYLTEKEKGLYKVGLKDIEEV